MQFVLHHYFYPYVFVRRYLAHNRVKHGATKALFEINILYLPSFLTGHFVNFSFLTLQLAPVEITRSFRRRVSYGRHAYALGKRGSKSCYYDQPRVADRGSHGKYDSKHVDKPVLPAKNKVAKVIACFSIIMVFFMFNHYYNIHVFGSYRFKSVFAMIWE